MITVFNIGPGMAALVKEEGLETIFEHAVRRSDFLAAFPNADFSETRQLSYEPSRPLYHIIELDYSVTDFGADPTSDPRMDYIHKNINAIVSWFEADHAEQEAVDLTVY